MDEECGETYHHGWGPAEHAAHRERIAGFVSDDDRLALIAEDLLARDEPRVGMLLASLRHLDPQASRPDERMFLDTLWPLLPRGWAPADGRFTEVFQLWVRSDRRRQGIASMLKHALADATRQRGIELIYTHTRATNPHVVTLNERLGYVVFREGPLWDDVVRICLAKRITQS